MFRLCNRSFVGVCSKYEKSTGQRSCVVFHKNTFAAARDNEHVVKSLKKPISNYHHDALDVYTSTLVLENMTKWKTRFPIADQPTKIKSKSKSKSMASHDGRSVDYTDRLITYLQRCLDGRCTVKEHELTRTMMALARLGHVNGLVLVERISAKNGHCIKKSELQINLAEAHWTNGNLDEMFVIFETFYPAESMRANYVLEPVIYTIVKSRGTASVVMVSKFVHTIVSKHRDHCPMSILWKYLFLSELYDDNLEAEKLMRQNSDLMENIQFLIPSITKNMLKKHKIHCVQRLMTMLLKYNQMTPYQWVLQTLFEYYHTLGNVRQCKEIMKHSIDLNVPLTQAQQSRLINMVLNNKHPQHINKEVSATIFKLMF